MGCLGFRFCRVCRVCVLGFQERFTRVHRFFCAGRKRRGFRVWGCGEEGLGVVRERVEGSGFSGEGNGA